MKIELTDNQRKNLIAFMDRVEARGIGENRAYMEILHSLENPLSENKPQAQETK